MSDRDRYLFPTPQPDENPKLPPPSPRVAERPNYDFNLEVLRLAYEQSTVTPVVVEAEPSTAVAVRAIPAIEPLVEEEVPPETGDIFLPGPGYLGETDTYVPTVAEQRLIYYWLLYGPDWAQDIIMQTPPEIPASPGEAPIINPLDMTPPRVGDGYDGAQRMVRLKL